MPLLFLENRKHGTDGQRDRLNDYCIAYTVISCNIEHMKSLITDRLIFIRLLIYCAKFGGVGNTAKTHTATRPIYHGFLSCNSSRRLQWAGGRHAEL